MAVANYRKPQILVFWDMLRTRELAHAEQGLGVRMETFPKWFRAFCCRCGCFGEGLSSTWRVLTCPISLGGSLQYLAGRRFGDESQPSLKRSVK